MRAILAIQPRLSLVHIHALNHTSDANRIWRFLWGRAALRGGPGAVRDLIKVGLSEPADALATYGISAVTLVPGGRAWVMQCHHIGHGDAKPPALVEAVGAPIGNFGGRRGGTSVVSEVLQASRYGGSSRSSALMPRRYHDRCWGDTLWSSRVGPWSRRPGAPTRQRSGDPQNAATTGACAGRN